MVLAAALGFNSSSRPQSAKEHRFSFSDVGQQSVLSLRSATSRPASAASSRVIVDYSGQPPPRPKLNEWQLEERQRQGLFESTRRQLEEGHRAAESARMADFRLGALSDGVDGMSAAELGALDPQRAIGAPELVAHDPRLLEVVLEARGDGLGGPVPPAAPV